MNVKVCVGARCTMMGANGILDGIEDLERDYFSEGGLEIEPINCMNACKGEHTSNAPVVVVDDQIILNANLQEVSEWILHKAKKIKE